MKKIWQNTAGFDGKSDTELEKLLSKLNDSIAFDKKLFVFDIKGSIAHVKMLTKTAVLTEKEGSDLVLGLESILSDVQSGILKIDESYEDIHSFVEGELTKRLPEVGKKLHTGRSRNDQVALDMRLYTADAIENISDLLKQLIGVLCDVAEKNTETVMSGYTHLQRAQPVTFGHYMMAYASMFLRDYERLLTLKQNVMQSPLGAGALAGVTYPIDREYTAELLGFNGVCINSLDAVSDRDYLVAFLTAISLIMTHLSRFSEEIILWSSTEFSYVKLSKEFSTGSSIMPQKRNPDMAELTRGKTGRVFGHLMGLLTTLKGLPLAYNKDMQEDKESVFDAVETVTDCLKVFAPMIANMQINKKTMLESAKKGVLAATDMAEYLVGKGVAFRDGYIVISNLVDYCTENDKTFEQLTLDEYHKFSEKIGDDIYEFIDLFACVERRNVLGGPSKARVLEQISIIKEKLK